MNFLPAFGFDQIGFQRASQNFQPLTSKAGHALVTGASRGIGRSVLQGLQELGMQALGLSRQPPEESHLQCDLSEPESIQEALDQIVSPLDVLILNAGAMPNQIRRNSRGHELIFASQVMGHLALFEGLANSQKLKVGARVIFVSSGGMYLKKLDLRDVHFRRERYDKYRAYANAKRAQVELTTFLSQQYPAYEFGAMHPGWVRTQALETSMPWFVYLYGDRLRTPQMGADTILWMATSQTKLSGAFYFDRSQSSPHIGNWTQTTPDQRELLYECGKEGFSLSNHPLFE